MFSATAARYSALLGDGLRTLASRQIAITTSRPLRKIADRRIVLGALQKYGEVVTFKHVKVSTLEKGEKERERERLTQK